MKLLTGSMPIAALPPSTAASAKKELLSTIEWLQSEGAATETNLKLLTAIVESFFGLKNRTPDFYNAGLMQQLSYSISVLKIGSLKNQRHHVIITEIGISTNSCKITLNQNNV